MRRNQGRFGRYWEMKEFCGKGRPGTEVFKCTDCGGVTRHSDGFNGEPDVHRCGPNCRSHATDWKPGNRDRGYGPNFDRTFPNSPGAGI